MEMIIGGAFQGKKELAKQLYPDIHWVSGMDISKEELFQAEGVFDFHEFLKKELKEKKDLSGFASELIEHNPNILLISDEVGYGVVPMDTFDRAYREAVGRVCTELASYSAKVIRVVCGIGTVIKEPSTVWRT